MVEDAQQIRMGDGSCRGALAGMRAVEGLHRRRRVAVNAVAPTIIAELSPVQLRGLYQGIFGSAWGLAFFVGPLLGGWVFGTFSPDVLWPSCAALGGVVAAGFPALSSAARRRLARDNEGDAAA